MTAAEKLNTSATNGTKVLDAPDATLRPGMNRRVIFMRKLEVADGAKSEYSFEPPHDGDDMVQHTVALKRIILGVDADPQELCVIELETKVDSGVVEKFPLAYLRQDTLQVPIELFLSEAAKIRIVKGKGPVFIVGEYAEEWRDDEVEADESGNELDEEDLSEEDEVAEGNKENGVLTAVRKRKMNKENEIGAAKKLRQEDAAPDAMDADNAENGEKVEAK